MLLGRHLRYIQKLRSNKVRAVKHSIVEGATFLIAVRPKLSSDRLFVIPVNFGNELNFEQKKRVKNRKGLHFSRHVGKISKRFAVLQM